MVNCAGQWAKQVGALAGVTVPLHSAEHFYVVTEQIDGVHRDLPVLRDPDGYTYIKEEVGGLVVGGFEPEAKPWVAPDALPYPFEFQLLEEDWDHFSILMDSAVHRIPVLAETGIKKFYNGPESFTPDNQFILGEAPELRNFFVAAGFNSVGIASAGGAGRALAEWITEGEPSLDLSAVDIRRFAPFNGNNQWLHDRVGEVLGLHYAIPWPNRELTSARPFRRSPGVSPARAGQRRLRQPRWAGSGPTSSPRPAKTRTSSTAGASRTGCPGRRAEQRAARTAVALFDQTSFSKYLLTGPDAERALQWLCTADVAVAAGPDRLHRDAQRARHLRGRHHRHPALGRGVPAGQQRRDHRTRQGPHQPGGCPPGCTPSLVDVTSAYAVYGVMGPRSRDLLAPAVPRRPRRRAVPVRHQPRDRPRLRHGPRHPDHLRRRARLGTVRARPSSRSASTRIWSPRATASAWSTPATTRSSRCGWRRRYRAFGRELTPDYNPVEAGLLFACKLKTGIRLPRPGGGREGPGRRPAAPPGLPGRWPIPRP